jgi:hypothetical protein
MNLDLERVMNATQHAVALPPRELYTVLCGGKSFGR